MIQTVISLLATLTLMGDTLIIITLLLIVGSFFKLKLLHQVKKSLSTYNYYFVFIISLIATLGSLFFSEVAHLTPCLLCWYQRIFMYPQPLLLYMAFMRIEKTLTPYLILMNTVGAIIALYHIIIQHMPNLSILPCRMGEVSCTTVQTAWYGYITIPVMAFTAFTLNILLLTLFNQKTKRSS